MFSKVPDEVYRIIEKIEENGFEAYMVGGCVRDCVMGIEPHDYDICTSALPEQTMEIFKGEGMVTAGLKHGTVGIIRDKNVYEITTYRLDGEYTDGRHPDSVIFTDKLKEDLRRRDFTINAMAYNPKTGLVDIYGGRDDLKNGVIRCVGISEERFSEDALRILRAIRFAARFNFEVEESTALAMKKLYKTIENVSMERINTEFTKTVASKNASRYLDEFRDIIALFIPEIREMFGFEQHNKYHCYDVWKHTLTALSNASDDIYVRLAVFFHDIAKPQCFTMDENGNGHFYTHAYEGEKITKKILKRMKYSNNIIDTVSKLVGMHDFNVSLKKKSVKKLLNKIGKNDFEKLMELRLADMSAHRQGIGKEDALFIDKVREIKNEIIEQNECFDLKSLAIGGRELMNEGIQPGPQIGKVLNKLLELVIEGSLQNEKKELISFAVDYIKNERNGTEMTKIDIFSGFLGAGKTTLIKKLIDEAYKGEKVVLIENEFGEIGIDGGFLQGSGVEISEMNSGCICCSLVGDFGEELEKVVQKYTPDRILIEPSGVGKLSDVIKAVQNLKLNDVVLNSFTTVADAKKCKMYIKNFGEFFNDQIENAGCIVLSHTQSINDEKLNQAVDLIREHNKNAVIVTTDWDKLSGKQLLEAMERKDTLDSAIEELHDEEHCCGHHHEHDEECCCGHHEHHHEEEHCEHNHEHHHHDEECSCGHHHEHEHHHEHGEECSCGHHHDHHHHHADEVFTSCGIETAKKFTEAQIKEILEKLEDENAYGMILRAKGIVEGENEWIHFDYIPGEPDVRCGSAGVIGRICVIGSKINETAIKDLFLNF